MSNGTNGKVKWWKSPERVLTIALLLSQVLTSYGWRSSASSNKDAEERMMKIADMAMRLAETSSPMIAISEKPERSGSDGIIEIFTSEEIPEPEILDIRPVVTPAILKALPTKVRDLPLPELNTAQRVIRQTMGKYAKDLDYTK